MLSRIDYNKFIYRREENIFVQPFFVALLKMSTTEEIDVSEPMLLREFVRITQRAETGWIRKPNQSRWDIDVVSAKGLDDKKMDEAIINIKLFQPQPLSEEKYDAVVMLGASIPNLAKRFFHLAELLKTKFFNKIFLMGSNDDVTPFRGNLELIVRKFPDQFKKSVYIPERLTEQEVMEFFIHNINGLGDEIKSDVVKLQSLVKKSDDGKIIKPTTIDELKKLKEYLVGSDGLFNLAIISHAPFYYR